MSELKGQLLGLVVVLAVFAAVSASLVGAFKTMEKQTESFSFLPSSSSVKGKLNSLGVKI